MVDVNVHILLQHQNQQQYDWVCKFCRKRTLIDYSKHNSINNINHMSCSDLQSEADSLKLKKKFTKFRCNAKIR